MIRILHSVSNMDRAGIETMLMNYYRNIDRSKVQFDFLCNKKKKGAYDEEILSMGGKIYRTPGLNPLKFPKYLKYMRELFKEHPEYNIIHAHNGALGVYALYAARKNNIKHRIFHAHGASITFDLKWPLKMFCRSRLLNNCNHNWTCGIEAARCYFGNKNVEKGNYTFVPNAIDVEKFAFSEETRNNIRKENNLKDKFVIGHIGRFMKQKNHSFLVDIFNEIHKMDSSAVLVFLGDGELEDEIRKKVSSLGLTDSVIFKGNVSNAHEWYQAFDVFVLPSVWEGLPVVGVEAQAASLPCVFSASVTKEIKLTDNAKFISLDDNAKAWADEIIKSKNNSIRKDMTGEISKAGYNIKVEAYKLQEMYENMARGL